MRLSTPIVAFLCLLAISCGREKREARTAFQIIAGDTQTGHFRGISMRNNFEEVRARESIPLEEEKEDELVYRAPLDKADSSYFKVYYTFDELGLFEIQADIFPENEKDARHLYERFRKHFDKSYGSSSGPPYYATWNTKTAKNRKVEVTLINETKDAGKPFLSINFFEPMEKEY